MKEPTRAFRDLYALFAAAKNEQEAEMLVKDLLTPRERKSVAERWQLIQALASGMKQREIKEKLHISISKITRGSHALKYGSGGFRLFLKRLKKSLK